MMQLQDPKIPFLIRYALNAKIKRYLKKLGMFLFTQGDMC